MTAEIKNEVAATTAATQVEVPEVKTEIQPSIPNTQVVNTELPATSNSVKITKKEQDAVGELKSYSKDELNALVGHALNNTMTDEMKNELKDNGLEEHFDLMVSGYKARQEKNDTEIYSAVGGAEAYAELQKWAVTVLNDKEIASYNKVLLGSDIQAAKLIVEGLQSRYQRENGKAPKVVIEGGGSVIGETGAFSSRQDYINETRTLKYKTDRDYAAKVEQRRNVSGF